MSDFAILILAAGQGKRMQSNIPKPLTLLREKTFIEWIVEASTDSKISGRPHVVVSPATYDPIQEVLGNQVKYVLQKEPRGTGHAVMEARDALKNYKYVMVLNGDAPMITSEIILNLSRAQKKFSAPITFITTTVDSYNGWKELFYEFGRIKRDRSRKVAGIVEYKDATDAERHIKEVNAGFYCFEAKWLWENLPKLRSENAQSEYYITDLLHIAIEQGDEVFAMPADPLNCMAVNTKEHVLMCEQALNERSILYN